jgi:2-dehydro-3-deoxygalactonokinase
VSLKENAPAAAHFALADWGTTHLRVWLTDETGHVLGVDESANGMGALKPEQFAGVLEATLNRMGARSDVPVMICGMAGARQGWREAPYADCPIALTELPARAIGFGSHGRAVAIMPGVARRDLARPDVMRGEETQLLGLAIGFGLANGIACMPGTHSKWVRVADGRIADFATAMTGELYAMLTQHSILRHATAASDGGRKPVSGSDPVFLAHVSHALDESGGLARLFSVRAGSLLNGARAEDGRAALSGLLIGAELRGLATLIGARPGPIMIVGSGSLASLYQAALQMAGFQPEICRGEDAVRAGLLAAARLHFTRETTAAKRAAP